MKTALRIIGILVLTLSFAFTTIDKKVVVIDVAHGGVDEGKKINGTSEKEIVFQVAQKIKALNKNPNLEIVLTRESDEFLTLKERRMYINSLNPDAVISLHANFSLNTDKSGTEIMVGHESLKKEDSQRLVSVLYSNLGFRKIEITNATRFMLRGIDYPSVIIELGFLSNTEDFNFLTCEGGQNQLALSILKSVE